ncbi:hypothetical protein HMPREF9622_02060 [Cutibacterium modestum HL037PA3]|nr:hypothetical protein HMPREF9622_02060 [Cutibacterium modestum HL037PA3]
MRSATGCNWTTPLPTGHLNKVQLSGHFRDTYGLTKLRHGHIHGNARTLGSHIHHSNGPLGVVEPVGGFYTLVEGGCHLTPTHLGRTKTTSNLCPRSSLPT